ncbi:MAG: ATP-binding protein [Treponema sp.]|jgi:predicted AAA+ superfamily ATPase|nr:ATP-binding protein [Treponema sp.]
MIDINSITLFANVRDSALLRSLHKTLRLLALEHHEAPKIAPRLARSWAKFSATIAGFEVNAPSFYHALTFLTLTDDNQFTHAAETGAELPPLLAALAKTDLSRLGRIAVYDVAALGVQVAGRLRNAGFEQAAHGIEVEAHALNAAGVQQAHNSVFPAQGDWGERLPAFVEYLKANGAGQVGLYHAFHWGGALADGALTPVRKPDPVRLADLSGYEEQRSVVVANTLRFLEGGSANNLLLYGDRGTGKSATVKAICNEYAVRGLRLLELPKQSLSELSLILETLGSRAMRFIIFIDDLSFEAIDDFFTSLKMLLEGGIEARPANVVIYATSNRRHLVKERFADRPTAAQADSEVRAFDTMQEQFSLADRFGLTVVYTSPSQDEYLSIAEHIATQRGILLPETYAAERGVFRENAIRWERWFNGRSPRTAVQYVDWLAGGAGFPWLTLAESR